MDKSFQNYVNLNIFQWNARSIRPKLRALENLLILEKVHIVTLSETWLDPECDVFLKNYNIFRNDRDDQHGGVAIFVHKSIQAQLGFLPSINNVIEIVFVRVFNCSHLENIFSVYCSSNVSTSQSDWDTLFSYVNRKSLILGDFNGHHTCWSYKTERRGSQIFKAFLDNDYAYLNNGEATRFQWRDGTLRLSSPDISFASLDISSKFQWSVTNESIGSDHNIIKISTQFEANLNFIEKRNFNKADWLSYRVYLDSIFDNISLNDDLQDTYNIFLKNLHNAAKFFIPVIKRSNNPQSKFRPKPYWNAELSKSVALRRLALKNFRRNPTPENLSLLQNRIREFQKLLRNSQKESWQNFCSSLHESCNVRDVWQRMRWLKGHKAPKQYVEVDRASALLHSLSPDFVSPPEPRFCSINQELERMITVSEMEKSIKLRDTAPGCDNISYSMLKHLPYNGKRFLLELFNRFLHSGFVPEQWRDINVIPIPKPGRDPRSVSSLRPISMISCVCKVFHSILQKRLEWFYESKGLFSDKTVGFRKCRSCLDNLGLLVTDIQKGFCTKKVTVGCFIDIDSAYNNVDVLTTMTILDGSGVGQKICKYLWEFLKERYLKIYINFSYITRCTGRGLAQGDPLSPLLFNIVTMSICKQINNVNILQYADDFVLYTTSKFVSDSVTKLQVALDLFSCLLRGLGLDISPTKSKVCIFQKGCKRNSIQLQVDDVDINLSPYVKYLGMWLDSSLRWSKHINEIANKASTYLNLLKILAGSGWGVHPKHLRYIYMSIVRSRLDYASFLFDDSAHCHTNKLDKIQNAAMRIIGGFLKTTPIHVMQSELCLQPLTIRRRYLGSKFLLKSKSLHFNTKILSILEDVCCERYAWNRKKEPLLWVVYKRFKNVLVNCPTKLEMFSLKYWVSYIDITKTIFVHVDGIEHAKNQYSNQYLKQTCLQYINEKYSNFYKIFTDGSKFETDIGAAFYDPQTNTSVRFRIESEISIMSAELTALVEALSYTDSISHSNIVIFTDSKSSLQHIARCTSTFRGISSAYRVLDAICLMRNKNKNIKLQWLPSHIGIHGNETADQLAKEAATEGISLFPIPHYSDSLIKVKIYCSNLWKEYFDKRSRDKGIWYRTIEPEPLQSPRITECVLQRRELVVAMRLRSGHIPTNKFKFLVHASSSPNCSACGLIEDVHHVLLECARSGPHSRSLNIGNYIQDLVVLTSKKAKILIEKYFKCINI